MPTRSFSSLILLTVSYLLLPSTAEINKRANGQHYDDQEIVYPMTTFGPEGSDPETTSYFFNHISLNVRNMTGSVDFYTSVLGMRLLFTVQVSPHASISYMGYSNGGKNGTGYQTTEELNRDKNNAQGLIELIWIGLPGAAGNSSTEVTNTFANLGLVVADPQSTEIRLDEYGVDIYKRFGADLPREGPFARATGIGGDVSGLNPEEFESIWTAMNTFTKESIYAADPDGNMIAIQGPRGPQL